jgi:hypothetical protein
VAAWISGTTNDVTLARRINKVSAQKCGNFCTEQQSLLQKGLAIVDERAAGELDNVSARKSGDFCTGQQLFKQSRWIQQSVCSEIM